MTVYYNEIDPHAALWIQRLIIAKELPYGHIDTRSIEDVRPSDLRGYKQCHFFAGIGGWPLALRLAGWPDDRPVWTGSCPCQPFSAAGAGAGLADERHLWPSWLHLIAQCRPATIFGEQVASPSALAWLDLVQDDLEGQDYACGASDLCAASVGAVHIRQRLWWVAHAKRDEQSREEPRRWSPGRMGRVEQSIPWDTPWPGALSRLRILGNGLPRCVAGTDAARNAIVPALAAEFIQAAGALP